MAEALKRADVARRVIDLGRQGCLTGRDELLLRVVAEVGGLTLGQARRLGWADAAPVVAYQRLNRLRGWGLLASTPLPPAVAAWGLGPVYQPGTAGQMWLDPQATLDWRGRPGHWAEPLLAAELLTRLVAGEGATRWLGPTAVQPHLELKVTVSGAAAWPAGQVVFSLGGLAQRSVDWAGLVRGFDLSAQGRKKPLPPLALLLPDAAQAAQVGDLMAGLLRKGAITAMKTLVPKQSLGTRVFIRAREVPFINDFFGGGLAGAGSGGAAGHRPHLAANSHRGGAAGRPNAGRRGLRVRPCHGFCCPPQPVVGRNFSCRSWPCACFPLTFGGASA